MSSWKWVANRVGHPISAIRCSEMAQARPNPSNVEVPRPNSSMMTSELLEAPCSSAVQTLSRWST